MVIVVLIAIFTLLIFWGVISTIQKNQEIEQQKRIDIEAERDRIEQQRQSQEKLRQESKFIEQQKQLAQFRDEEKKESELLEQQRYTISHIEEELEEILKLKRLEQEVELQKLSELATKTAELQKEAFNTITKFQSIEIQYEQGTMYSEQIGRIIDPPYFDSFRHIAIIIVKDWDVTHQNQIWNSLSNGVAIINNEDALASYIHSFGIMHKAKLYDAFDACAKKYALPVIGANTEIVDYGCGQALASVCLLDYLQEKLLFDSKINQIILIESSVKALMRGGLHLKHISKYFNPSVVLKIVNKNLDELVNEDLETSYGSVKIHLLSNILDVPDFDVKSLYDKICRTQRGKNLFICVSPTYGAVRDARMRTFFMYFNLNHDVIVISNRKDDVQTKTGPKTRQEITFFVEIS